MPQLIKYGYFFYNSFPFKNGPSTHLSILEKSSGYGIVYKEPTVEIYKIDKDMPYKKVIWFLSSNVCMGVLLVLSSRLFLEQIQSDTGGNRMQMEVV